MQGFKWPHICLADVSMTDLPEVIIEIFDFLDFALCVCDFLLIFHSAKILQIGRVITLSKHLCLPDVYKMHIE